MNRETPGSDTGPLLAFGGASGGWKFLADATTMRLSVRALDILEAAGLRRPDGIQGNMDNAKLILGGKDYELPVVVGS